MSIESSVEKPVSKDDGAAGPPQLEIAAGSVWRQIGNGLHWLNERALAFTALTLFISVLYLHSYINEQHVPLSITSSAIIGALPTMFAFLVLVIGALTVFIFSPTLMLFAPVIEGSAGRMADTLAIKSVDQDDHPRFGGGVIIGWFGTLFLMCLVIGLMGLIPSEVFDRYANRVGAASLLVVPLAAWAFVKIVLKKHFTYAGMRQVTLELWVIVLAAFLLQFFLIAMTTSVVARIAASQEYGATLQLVLYVLGIAFLGMVQLLGARAIVSATKPDRFLGFAALVGFSTVGLLGLYPPTGAHLTGTVLHVTASGSRPCAILTWIEDEPSGVQAIQGATPNRSRPLRILTEDAGYYLVRHYRASGNEVHFVPRPLVAAMDACSAEERQSTATS